MSEKSVYCEECVEDIPNDECFWDDKRLYCGRCGSELEVGAEAPDVFEALTTQAVSRLLRTEEDEGDDEEEEEEDEPALDAEEE